MKVTIKSTLVEKKKYPYLGISNTNNNLIVLFSDTCKGTVLNSGSSPHSIGTVSTLWAEKECFIPFNDPITLQND
jgi:hypothetical protein